MKSEGTIGSYPLTRGVSCFRGRDDAVSPAIGVMLMLVVTILVATVVSGFAGGLVGGEGSQKAPSLAMDVVITNSGGFKGSEFSATVLGVSEPIPTRDLKIVTSWETTVKTNTYYENGAVRPGRGCIVNPDQYAIGDVYHGGAEILPGVANSFTGKTALSVAPYGFGPGVGNYTESDMENYGYNGPIIPMYNWHFFAVTHFGNYSLEQGTVMMAEAAGRCIYYPSTGGEPEYTYPQGGYGAMDKNGGKWVPWYYSVNNAYRMYIGDKTIPTEVVADGGQADGMQAVLGYGWDNLRAGDTVNVKVVHIPSGKTIFDKDVVVKEV